MDVPKVVPKIGASPKPAPWFWKASLDRYPLEFWSEVIAYQLGEVAGVEVPPCFPSVCEETYGSLSHFFVDRFAGEFLVHGGDLFAELRPGYDRKRGREHSVQLVLDAMAVFARPTHFEKLFEQFVFDGLIGNGDRHQDNWGVVIRPEGKDIRKWPERLAPTFDNGTSMAREVTETNVDNMLQDSMRFEAYLNRGKSHVRWEEEGELIEVTHEDLMARILLMRPNLRSTAERILNFDLVRARSVLERIGALSQTCSGVEISETRQELMFRLISRRRERLCAVL